MEAKQQQAPPPHLQPPPIKVYTLEQACQHEVERQGQQEEQQQQLQHVHKVQQEEELLTCADVEKVDSPHTPDAISSPATSASAASSNVSVCLLPNWNHNDSYVKLRRQCYVLLSICSLLFLWLH